jgi:hypothetical protein
MYFGEGIRFPRVMLKNTKDCITMVLPEEDLQERRNIAIKKCEQHIEWFTKHKTEARYLHSLSQVLVIVIGALTQS